MIAAILGALYVIGMILLFILVFILLILAMFLLIPFRYRIEGVTFPKPDEPEKQIFQAEARLHWLFRFFDIDIKYKDGLKIIGRIAWFRFFDMDTKNSKEENMGSDANMDLYEMEESFSGKKEELSEEEILKKDGILKESEIININQGNKREWLPNFHKEENKKEKQPEKSIKIDVFLIADKIEGLFDTMVDKWDNFVQKTEEWEEKFEKFRVKILRLQNQFEDEKNRNAIGILTKFAGRVCGHIAPKSIYGRILLGFDNPASTGQAVAILSILRTAFCPELRLESDFERKIVEVDIHAKGRICIGNLAWFFVLVIIKKDVWRLYRNFKRIRKDWKNGG